MTLNLDLTACDAKLARARENLATLLTEAKASVTKEATHAVRFSTVDPQTGWCSISLVPQKVDDPRLSAILGDIIHNLRCVLDYVVTALVDASGTPLTTLPPVPHLQGHHALREQGRHEDAGARHWSLALHRVWPRGGRGLAAVLFITPPWQGDDDLTIPLGAIPGIIEHVKQLVDSFRLL